MTKNKKKVLKDGIVNVLGGIIFTWILFVGTTIESVLSNKVYDTILVIYTALAILSFILLKKYSNVFDEEI